MNKRQKQIAIIAGAAIAAWLLYSYIRGRQTSNQSTASDTGGTPVDTSASDYAALAGQEQGDMAALQSQNQSLFGQEQGDVATLQAQEMSDVSGITGTLAGITSQFDAFTSGQSLMQSDIAAIATGLKSVNRRETQTATVKPGGKFADYYKRVTGRAAPATIPITNVIYEAYKAGVKAAALQPTPHPSAPKNTNVAHPNGNHQQQTGTHKKLPSGGAPAAPKNKPKTSGTRK